MDQQSSSTVLTKWAAIFREEGDIETAGAIDLQLERVAQRTLSEEDAEWLKRVLGRAWSFDRRGDFEAAADSYAEALRTVEGALGTFCPEIVEHLGNVARCQLNAGFYEQALAGFSRLLRLVQAFDENDDYSVAAPARQYIRFCERNIRDVVGTMRLQAHMNDVLRHSQSQSLTATVDRADRMRCIALRLVARGRPAAAIRLHEAAVTLRLRHAEPDGEPALLAIHGYARDLWGAGEAGRAAAVLTKLVATRNRKSAWMDQRQQLGEVLTDLAACLSGQGQARSAQEARAIAELIARGGSNDDSAAVAA